MAMSESDPRSAEGSADDDRPESYLDDLPDGSGCVEIWDHLSDRRTQD